MKRIVALLSVIALAVGALGATFLPLTGAGSSGPQISVVTGGYSLDGTDASSYTFNGLTLAHDAASRVIVLGIACRMTAGTVSVTSVTLDGNAATFINSGVNTQGGNSSYVSLWTIADASGATGDVAVTTAAPVARCGVQAWAMYGASATATSSAGSSDAANVNPPTISTVNLPGPGAAFGLGYGNGTSFSWTGVVQDTFDCFSDNCSTQKFGSAHAVYEAADASLTVNFTSTVSGQNASVAATFGLP